MQAIETKLLDVLNATSACSLGITSGSRLFAKYGANRKITEILVLVDIYDIWGHVFHYDGYWYTTLVIFPIAIDAHDINDLFKNFWSRIELANKDPNSMFWFPANDSNTSYKALYRNDSFNGAIKALIHIFHNYEKWHNGLDAGECSNYCQVKEIYGNVASHFKSESLHV
ncbi:hypothetical protein [Rickettsia sp. TH2014]|uniref:hypothetical protein n=2 Tax=Rickettsia sp. TH2014 TaxID=1967503 RepID=UPI001C487AA2|nr:hypothetical protein [Rickettsia sp. TH2014]